MHQSKLRVVEDNELFSIDLELVDLLIQQGGPKEENIQQMRILADYINDASIDVKTRFYEKLKPILNLESLLGWTFLKPHGYAGDFELIDKIHTNYISPNPKYKNWDIMYHKLSACEALRNRKQYFNQLLDRTLKEKGSITILNLGSGPARDVKEYLDERPNVPVLIDCVDMDFSSLAHAKDLCINHLDKVRFFEKNVLTFVEKKQYDLVWSAGMFDYFNDKLFMRLVKKYYNYVKPGGELVLGNISKTNIDKISMEVFGKWVLHHRSKDDLNKLIMNSGINYLSTAVHAEPTGVNIFTHTVKK